MIASYRHVTDSRHGDYSWAEQSIALQQAKMIIQEMFTFIDHQNEETFQVWSPWRWAGVRISETADLLRFPHAAVSREKNERSGKFKQYQKHPVMDGSETDRLAYSNNHLLHPSWAEKHPSRRVLTWICYHMEKATWRSTHASQEEETDATSHTWTLQVKRGEASPGPFTECRVSVSLTGCFKKKKNSRHCHVWKFQISSFGKTHQQSCNSSSHWGHVLFWFFFPSHPHDFMLRAADTWSADRIIA